MHVVRVQAHHAAAVVHRQIGVVILGIGNEGQGVHERDGLVVVGEMVGLLNGDVSAIARQAPAFEFGQVCYNFGSCLRTTGKR